jgi:phosphoribosylaminoimidazole-succinocarboxamide synthase
MLEPATHVASGKVREIYALDDERLLLTASDRISTFDVVLPTEIPDKGRVLTGLSAFWFARTRELVPNHLLALRPDGRSMECRRLEMLPIECVVRGYLSGSAWKEYGEHGTLAGEPLPQGLKESARLEPPVFSPATKAETGHDENISMSRMARLVGTDTAAELERLSRQVYQRGRDIAGRRGVIIADTKFEFGRARRDNAILLVDEVLTPDSSRFWPAEQYAAGRAQPSFDKQPLRDYLDAERKAGRWNGEAPPPPLPAEVVEATSRRYLRAYERITGTELHLTRLS